MKTPKCANHIQNTTRCQYSIFLNSELEIWVILAKPTVDKTPKMPAPTHASMYPQQRSNWWYLLPILLGIIGGLVAFFVLRRDDPDKAKNCLYIGVALMIIGIVFNLAFIGGIEQSGPDGFMPNF